MQSQDRVDPWVGRLFEHTPGVSVDPRFCAEAEWDETSEWPEREECQTTSDIAWHWFFTVAQGLG